jgi:hypothetical protein
VQLETRSTLTNTGSCTNTRQHCTNSNASADQPRMQSAPPLRHLMCIHVHHHHAQARTHTRTQIQRLICINFTSNTSSSSSHTHTHSHSHSHSESETHSLTGTHTCTNTDTCPSVQTGSWHLSIDRYLYCAPSQVVRAGNRFAVFTGRPQSLAVSAISNLTRLK